MDGISNNGHPVRAPFPHDTEEFDNDERISFSKVSNKYILEAEDGQEFEYEATLKRWVPVVRYIPPMLSKGSNLFSVMPLVLA